MRLAPYELTTYADAYGVWHCRAVFQFPGLGNTGPAEEIKHRALAAAKRRIRAEIAAREASPVRRLSYEIADNKIDNMNRLHSFTVREK